MGTIDALFMHSSEGVNGLSNTAFPNEWHMSSSEGVLSLSPNLLSGEWLVAKRKKATAEGSDAPHVCISTLETQHMRRIPPSAPFSAATVFAANSFFQGTLFGVQSVQVS